MVKLITSPAKIKAAGTLENLIDEYVGNVAVCLPAFTPDAVHRDE